MQQPLRVLMTREGNDADDADDAMRDVPAFLPFEPSVGHSLKLFLDDGKCVQTSAVKRIVRAGSQLLVETANSLYRLVAAPAAA